MKPTDYSKAYSETSLWEKVGAFAMKGGRELIEKVLTLYEVLKDKDTPVWAKSVIVGALGYFISPVDAIPDVVPVVGLSDDLGALTLAAATVLSATKDEHVAAAKAALRRWFGSEAE